jgi:CheY-like chemotaxis protein
LTEANAVVTAVPEPGRLVSVMPPEIDKAVGVIFLAADAGVSHRDRLRLPQDYSVIDASTVEAAAALSQGHPLDLVILDLGRAAVGGLAMLRQLRADPRLAIAPLVLLGAFEDIGAIHQGLQLGARDYLIRGETTPSLVARRVESWLYDPSRRALSRRSSRPALAGRAPDAPAPVPARHVGLVELLGGSFVGLVALLLNEKRFLVVGHAGKRT